MIGRHKYGFLKGIKEPTEAQQAQIDEYEKHHRIGVVYPRTKPTITPETEGVKLTKRNLYNFFIRTFNQKQGVEFFKTEHSISNLEPVVKYFSNDETFADSKRVLKEYGGKELQPSLNKGLLIVGHSGNGKTATMDAMQDIFHKAYMTAKKDNWINADEWTVKRFLKSSAVDLSLEFEACKNATEKEMFFKKYSGYRYFFDDVGRESVSSNYGKRDIFADIIFKRDEKNALTHATMNYMDGGSCIEETLSNFGQRYGSHNFDRLFKMFNIIEFKGVSFRR